MLKNILLQQKSERDRLLAKNYVPREKLGIMGQSLDSSLIKVVIGPRRAGKSVFSLLLLQGKDFAYVNFDDENLLNVRNYDELLSAISDVYGASKLVLFDEIQNMPLWEEFVNKLQRRGYNLILTGSNARLLSSELATALTGRYLSAEVFPFSFREFLSAKNFAFNKKELLLPDIKGRVLNYLDEYLKKGGFPAVVTENIDPKSYLETLFEAILFKDVAKRFNIRFPQKLYELILYLVSNFCAEFSFTSLKNGLGFRSVNTVQNYLGYLEESYLFFSLSRFSFKMKEQFKAPKKAYFTDNGFIMAKSFQFSPNSGRLMENLVFVELMRKGLKPNQEIFYYQTKNKKEVDFLVKAGPAVKELIQVCFDAQDTKTKNREVAALIEASGELSCDSLLVITWDYEADEIFEDKKISFKPLWKWLLV